MVTLLKMLREKYASCGSFAKDYKAVCLLLRSSFYITDEKRLLDLLVILSHLTMESSIGHLPYLWLLPYDLL